MKHCIEKEKIPLNYDSSEFDGALILAAQPPTSTRPPSSAPPPPPPPPSSANKNLPPLPKDFQCSIW